MTETTTAAAGAAPAAADKPKEPELIRVRIDQLRMEAEDVRGIELVTETGAPLPAFKAGAHIDIGVILPTRERVMRSYSIASAPSEQPFMYHLVIQYEEHGTGGSIFLHEKVKQHYILEITPPKNFFELKPDAEHSILIAGGVGIAPILAMAYELTEQQKPFELHYTAHNERRMGMRKQVQTFGDAAHMYIGRDPKNGGIDLRKILANPKPNSHVYVCGPHTMIDDVYKLAREAGWADGTVHSEVFKKPDPRPGDGPVDIVIKSTGQIINVPAKTSILDAVLAAGVKQDFDCKVGTCGTCAVNVVEGTPDHRDNCLLISERTAGRMCTCVSRAQTPRLVLDL